MPPKKKRSRGPPRATHRPSFRKRQEIELFLPKKLKNAIKIKKSVYFYPIQPLRPDLVNLGHRHTVNTYSSHRNPSIPDP
jgi:hypothetical protein